MPSSADSTTFGTRYPISACGDDLLSIRIGTASKCQVVARQLRESGHWIECVAGIESVVVQFDAAKLGLGDARKLLQIESMLPVTEAAVTSEVIEIPVCYGGEFGPDLDRVSETLGLSPVEVIRRHCATVYTVDMLGFLPGFAYIGGLDDDIDIPRLTQPRVRVAAGSIGIADGRTGVYALAGPGGWSIIGRTPLTLFDPSAEQAFTLQAASRVRFSSISTDEFKRLVYS